MYGFGVSGLQLHLRVAVAYRERLQAPAPSLICCAAVCGPPGHFCGQNRISALTRLHVRASEHATAHVCCRLHCSGHHPSPGPASEPVPSAGSAQEAVLARSIAGSSPGAALRVTGTMPQWLTVVRVGNEPVQPGNVVPTPISTHIGRHAAGVDAYPLRSLQR